MAKTAKILSNDCKNCVHRERGGCEGCRSGARVPTKWEPDLTKSIRIDDEYFDELEDLYYKDGLIRY